MQVALKLFRSSSLVLSIIAIVVTLIIGINVFESDIAIAIITASTTIFVAVFSAIWARNIEKTQAIEQQIREKKIPIYEDFLTVAFSIIFSQKDTDDEDKEEENPLCQNE